MTTALSCQSLGVWLTAEDLTGLLTHHRGALSDWHGGVRDTGQSAYSVSGPDFVTDVYCKWAGEILILTLLWQSSRIREKFMGVWFK